MNSFSLKRFSRISLYRFNMHKKVWLLQLAATLGIAIIITGLFFIEINEYDVFEGFYQSFYNLSLILSGAYISSRSFCEYSNTTKGFSYIMLPASSMEKFMVPAIFSGIIYFFLFSIAYTFMAAITNAFWSPIYDYKIFLFNPFNTSIFEETGILFMFYLILQPLFLYGSIAFRKNHFLYTGMSLFIVFLLLLLFALGYSKIVYGTTAYFDGKINPENLGLKLNYVLAFAFHIIVLVAAYFKLKGREI